MAFFNINRMETGNRIFEHRKAMNLSRDGLADLLSEQGVCVSITSIGKWERGECDISEAYARALAKVFGCCLCELVVARLSFYDDERDQLAPLKSLCFHFTGNKTRSRIERSASGFVIYYLVFSVKILLE